MSLIRFEPFKDIERLFENLPGFAPNVGWDLAVDLYEKEGNLVAEMHIPGIDPEKLDVTIEDGHLRISGTREESKETKEKTYYAREIRRGTFERTIRLPVNVKEGEAKAEYKDGVLRIILPKDQGKKINIKVN